MAKVWLYNVWVVIVYAEDGFGWADAGGGADGAADAFVWVDDGFVHQGSRLGLGLFCPIKNFG